MVVSLALLAPLWLTAIEAPVTAVTVYSDRARATRTGSVTLHGEETVELPLLTDGVDPRSIRLEARGADVRRVSVAPVTSDAFPLDQAQALLAQIREVDDALAKVRGEDDAYRAGLAELRGITPRLNPSEDPLRPAAKLNPAGWASVLAFESSNEEKLQGEREGLAKQRGDLERKRSQLVEQARLLGGAQKRSGYRVVATLSGHGAAELALTYETASARWYPTYDLALSPERGEVQVAFAGLVSQETGEDWTHAALTLSTAVPSASAAFPRLTTWTIGERERFIPTAVAAVEPPLQMPARMASVEASVDELKGKIDRTRTRLELLEGAVAGDSTLRGDADADHFVDQLDSRRKVPAMVDGEPKPEAEKPKEQKIMLGDIAIQGRLSNEEDKKEVDRPVEAPAPVAEPTPVAAASEAREESVLANLPGAVADGFFAKRDSAGAANPMPSAVGLSPPAAYETPRYAADLPASLAGGYDLAFRALQPETIASGGGARRVALMTQTWPVHVERKVFAALRPEAFLVAELKSPSPAALPGGTANLFVGADPAGTAKLDLVSPGQAFTLPLGLDRAVKPVRNVQVVEAEKGLFSKDDVTRYDVTTELANPYATPISVRVIDQWPLADQKEVEVQLMRTEPYALQDAVKGSLEWRVTIPPHGKTTVAFTYSIRRPHGWRMHQL